MPAMAGVHGMSAAHAMHRMGGPTPACHTSSSSHTPPRSTPTTRSSRRCTRRRGRAPTATARRACRRSRCTRRRCGKRRRLRRRTCGPSRYWPRLLLGRGCQRGRVGGWWRWLGDNNLFPTRPLVAALACGLSRSACQSLISVAAAGRPDIQACALERRGVNAIPVTPRDMVARLTRLCSSDGQRRAPPVPCFLPPPPKRYCCPQTCPPPPHQRERRLMLAQAGRQARRTPDTRCVVLDTVLLRSGPVPRVRWALLSHVSCVPVARGGG